MRMGQSTEEIKNDGFIRNVLVKLDKANIKERKLRVKGKEAHKQ
jgi:hypothetical protein